VTAYINDVEVHMAYPTRGRDPFLDAGTQAFLERRGVEALGLFVSAVGVAFALALASYAPEDSAWISAGGPEIQNWLGQIGAIVAAPLIKIMGLGSWSIALTFLAWGLRLIAHTGADRMIMRLIYAPIFWALCSLYAATLTPISSWSHSFSMGGLFGDTVLFMILQLLPGSVTLGANIVALVLGTLVVILGGYVTGLIFGEIKTFFRVTSLLFSRLILGLVFILARGWSGLLSRQERRASERSDPTMDPLSQSEAERVASVIRANPVMPSAPVGPALPAQPQPKSLFARVLKRGVAPESAQSPREPVVESSLGGAIDPMQDRIRGKIVEAIRSRDPQAAMAAQGQTPIVTAKPGRPTGPVPIILQHPAPEAPFMEDEAEGFEERQPACCAT
jgi:S-DNA-T family DNA segregation ATPase FtsK/SpoIIIE